MSIRDTILRRRNEGLKSQYREAFFPERPAYFALLSPAGNPDLKIYSTIPATRSEFPMIVIPVNPGQRLQRLKGFAHHYRGDDLQIRILSDLGRDMLAFFNLEKIDAELADPAEAKLGRMLAALQLQATAMKQIRDNDDPPLFIINPSVDRGTDYAQADIVIAPFSKEVQGKIGMFTDTRDLNPMINLGQALRQIGLTLQPLSVQKSLLPEINEILA